MKPTNESAYLELVKSFIEAGDNTNSMRITVLLAAIKRGYDSVAELLLSHNFVPLPRHILPFALQQCLPPRLVQLLIRNGADVHSTLNEDTIFHLAVANYNESACLELMNDFVEAGAGNANICKFMRKP